VSKWTEKWSCSEAPTRAEFLQKRLISAFFGFQWLNLAEILHLFKKYNNVGKVAVKRVSLTDYALWTHGSLDALVKNQAFPLTEAIICVVNLLMLQLRIFLSRMLHLRAFLSRMSWLRAFWRRILRRIFGRNSQKYAEFWQKFCGKNWPLEPLVLLQGGTLFVNDHCKHHYCIEPGAYDTCRGQQILAIQAIAVFI